MEKSDKICFVLDIPKNETKDRSMLERLHDPSVPFDIKYLTSDSTLKKVLVKDITIDKEELKDYKFIVTIGAEPFKKLLKLTGGVTRFAGTLVTDPYSAIPIISPGIIFINPAMADTVDTQFGFISKMYHNNMDTGTVTEKHYEHVDTVPRYLELMEELLNYNNSFIVNDLETTAFDPEEGEILQVVLCPRPHESYSIDFDIVKSNVAPLKLLMETKTMCFHNAKFDKKWLKNKLGIIIKNFECTLLVHYCFINQNKGTHSLKLLAMKHTDLGDYDRELDTWKKAYCRQNKIKVSEFSYGMIPNEILAPYACADGDATYQLWENMAVPAIKDAHEDTIRCYEEILKPASDMLMELEMSGAPVDEDAVYKLERKYARDIVAARSVISKIPEVKQFESYQDADFNPNSPKQIGILLFDYLKLPVQGKTATGNNKTDADTLKVLSEMSKVPNLILSLRKLGKMKGTYVDNVIELIKANGRLRGTFNLCSTTSGRLSSSQGGDE